MWAECSSFGATLLRVRKGRGFDFGRGARPERPDRQVPDGTISVMANTRTSRGKAEMNQPLRGKTALTTGGATRLARASALALAEPAQRPATERQGDCRVTPARSEHPGARR